MLKKNNNVINIKMISNSRFVINNKTWHSLREFVLKNILHLKKISLIVINNIIFYYKIIFCTILCYAN